jgi:RNA polymerase sigma factor (sigma-70 family)
MDPLEFSIDDCLQKDPGAWAKLVELVRPACLRVLVKLLGRSRPDVITDLEQEVYVRLLTRRPALESLRGASAAELRVYAATVALNLARDVLRRETLHHNAVHVLGDEPQPPDDMDAIAARQERLEQVYAQAERLTGGRDARDMQVFVAYYHEGYSAAEIAKRDLGLSTSGVESVVLRLTRLLRGLLTERESDS